MGWRGSLAWQGWVRFVFTLGLSGGAGLAVMPGCSSGEDFTASSTGGSGGSSGDASATGGAAGTGTGGASGSGTGGVAGSGTGGVAGSGTGGASGAGGSPGGKPNGQTCSHNTECASGYCVDDVCCETECTGDCRSCKIAGKEGQCAPYAQGTDPEGDCVGAGLPTDPCAGTCDGKAACSYPDMNQSCGAQVCSNASQSTFHCDGAGACKETAQSCAPYQCNGDTCLTTCLADSDCVSTHWCLGPQCEAKLGLGKKCPKDSACQSGICVKGACCQTTCGPNFTCGTGSCTCNGQTCATNEACVAWYKDADGDGFGAASEMVFACASKQPAGFVANDTDCYDKNANAKPGQTAFFTSDRGDGSFDYNCDGTQEKKWGVVNDADCTACGTLNICPLDATPPCTSGSFKCTSYLFHCPTSITEGFNSDVACGTPATLKKCNQNPTFEWQNGFPVPTGCANSASVSSTPNTVQACR